jgi:Ras-related GTP-binding protein C/D
MGLRRSGKTSIERVVFHKMGPNETLYLESTNKLENSNLSSCINFHVWDFPGQIDFFDPTFDSAEIFGGIGALVFVIDAQDDYLEALFRLHKTATRAYEVNPKMIFEVLIHKVDGLSDDYKMETKRDISQRTSDALADENLESIQLSFHLTSIYDHSIFEAFSKIIQKLIQQLPTLENLLNILCSNSNIEKAYLFDTVTKIYVATDASPVDPQSYEICSDMIDVILDLGVIYGHGDDTYGTNGNGMDGSGYLNGEYEDPAGQLSPQGTGTGSASSSMRGSTASLTPAKEQETFSLIRLNSGMVLYYRDVSKNDSLALICLLRADNFERHGLIDYNFHCFKEAIMEVFKLANQYERMALGDLMPPDGMDEDVEKS